MKGLEREAITWLRISKYVKRFGGKNGLFVTAPLATELGELCIKSAIEKKFAQVSPSWLLMRSILVKMAACATTTCGIENMFAEIERNWKNAIKATTTTYTPNYEKRRSNGSRTRTI